LTNSGSAADVFQRYGLGPTTFWQSVAIPPDNEVRPAAKLKNALEELGGVYLFFARFLLWRADLLPVEYLEALRQIDYGLPPVPRAQVNALLERELGALSSGLIAQLEIEPAWSTLSRTAYISWYENQPVIVQVGRERIPDREVAAFEAGIRHLGHADICEIASNRIVRQFKEWLRQAESVSLERSYLQVLAQYSGETLVDYPALIPEITTDQVLCWRWIEGETVTSLINRGAVEALTQVAVAVFEQLFALSMVDADLQTDSMVLQTGGNRLAVRRIDRPLSVPPPAVNLGMKYIAAVLEGNASLTVQTLLTLAVGRSMADLESDLLNLISGIEPELKVRRWFPGSAASFESNWRALARLQVTRPRPLYLDCLQRNLLAIGYWTSDAVGNGGPNLDPLPEAHWPVVSSLVRRNAAQFLDAGTVQEWSMGLGLLTFGAMREANRAAEELREGELTLEVEMPDSLPDIRRRDAARTGVKGRVPITVAALLLTVLVCLHWGSTITGAASTAMMALAVAALIGLVWVVSKIG
jgi:hypothetical protein